MKRPLLDIITITKNDSQGLAKNISSTKKLRLNKSVKQIVIDGSSISLQEENIQIVNSAKGNIKYFYQKPSGVASAFNFGIKKTTGKWVWFLNGGDEFNSEIDSRLLTSLLESSSAKMIVFNYLRDKSVIKKPPMHLLWPPIPNWLPHPAILIQRETLVSTGKFSEKYEIASDYEKLLDICLTDVEIDFISIPISRFSSGGLSADRKKAGHESLNVIFRKIILIFRRSANSYIQMGKGLKNYYLGK